MESISQNFNQQELNNAQNEITLEKIEIKVSDVAFYVFCERNKTASLETSNLPIVIIKNGEENSNFLISCCFPKPDNLKVDIDKIKAKINLTMNSKKNGPQNTIHLGQNYFEKIQILEEKRFSKIVPCQHVRCFGVNIKTKNNFYLLRSNYTQYFSLKVQDNPIYHFLITTENQDCKIKGQKVKIVKCTTPAQFILNKLTNYTPNTPNKFGILPEESRKIIENWHKNFDKLLSDRNNKANSTQTEAGTGKEEENEKQELPHKRTIEQTNTQTNEDNSSQPQTKKIGFLSINDIIN
ncbi:MAG: hypothetical protein Tsb0021_16800 [Chlamydiales bacterium]